MHEAKVGRGERGVFLADFTRLVTHRAQDAQPVHLFSSSDDKRVELATDPTGNRFVRRTYSPASLDWISGRSGLNFVTAYNSMCEDFERAGLNVVPSFILNPARQEGEPLVVVSRYLENSQPVEEASTNSKRKLATGLGNLLVTAEKVLPQPQMLRADMFRVVKTPDGEEIIVLTDIDPYVIQRETMKENPFYEDSAQARYIKDVASLFCDEWCDYDEREVVLGRFLKALGGIITSDPGMQTMNAFLDANLMKQGLDPR